MRLLVLKSFGLLMVLIAFGGCAHKIRTNPELYQIKKSKVQKNSVNVGYYISDADLKKEVITPAGGGDSVKYTPYLDAQYALETVLSKKFNAVFYMSSLNDKAYMKKKDIRYVFVPTIRTESSSTSVFTWPPTDFTFELSCYALDTRGKKVWSDKASAQAHVEFMAMGGQYGKTAQKASEEAFIKMLEKIDTAEVFNTASVATQDRTQSQSDEEIITRFEALKKLYDKGLISKDEYKEKKKLLIKQL